jgi:hypothetical protein
LFFKMSVVRSACVVRQRLHLVAELFQMPSSLRRRRGRQMHARNRVLRRNAWARRG